MLEGIGVGVILEVQIAENRMVRVLLALVFCIASSLSQALPSFNYKALNLFFAASFHISHLLLCALLCSVWLVLLS